MTHGARCLMLVTLLTMTSHLVNGHGRLIEPPSRSSAWRYGFSTPHNYDDNALNCGGLNTQWYVNNGKCGVCGDPWSQPAPRDNEAGGRYGKGVITRTYTPGQTVEVGVEVTANHRGWFEFRLCPHNDPTTPVTQQCLDNFLLPLADGTGTRWDLGTRRGRVDIKVKLPQGVTCSQCVLQWKWHAGNNAGNAQEEFYGCSDIAIGAAAATVPPVKITTAPPTARPTAPPTAPPTLPPTARPTAPPTPGVQPGTGACRAINSWQGVAELDRYCNEQCPLGNCPAIYCSCSASVTGQPTTFLPPVVTTFLPPVVTTSAPPITGLASCHAVGMWQGSPLLDLWCRENCAKGMCPADRCQCGGQAGSSNTPQPSTVLPTVLPTARLPPSTALPTAPPPATSTPRQQPTTAVSGPCYAIGVWAGQPELDKYCNEQCPLGSCPTGFCSCSGSVSQAPPSSTVIPRLQSTTAPKLNTATPSTVNLANRCVAIGSWQGMADRDQWCNANCPLGLCPSQNCQCGLPTTAAPITTSSLQCRAIGTWAGHADLNLWCQKFCPTQSCDANYCSCSPTVNVVTPTSSAPVSSSNAPCFAINGWAGQPQLDQYCYEQCRLGNCPPQYCACGPRAQATPLVTTALPTAPPRQTTPAAGGGATAVWSQCRGINAWQGVAELDRWCQVHCAAGECPPDFCSC